MTEPNVRIFHNPRCSKSREALALLREHQIEPEIVLYLEQELSVDALTSLCATLNLSPHALLRTKEAAYQEAGLSDKSSPSDIFAAIVAAPVLLERPIVVAKGRAVIARPPTLLLDLIGTH